MNRRDFFGRLAAIIPTAAVLAASTEPVQDSDSMFGEVIFTGWKPIVNEYGYFAQWIWLPPKVHNPELHPGFYSTVPGMKTGWFYPGQVFDLSTSESRFIDDRTPRSVIEKELILGLHLLKHSARDGYIDLRYRSKLSPSELEFVTEKKGSISLDISKALAAVPRLARLP